MPNLEVYFGRPQIGEDEIAAVNYALKRKRLTNAGMVMQFEERFQEFIGGGVAVAVSSCFAALHLALLIKGVGRDDEVIVPALTHCAVANAVEHVGGRCVFVDCHVDSGNIDPDLVEQAITPRTRAITLVHYLGIPAYMKSMLDISRRHNLPLIEDCALALGTRHEGSGKHVGLIGDIGCFSFYPAKHITTGEGGMLTTNEPISADAAKRFRSFGYTDRFGDIENPGCNYRMTELQAALGVAQMKRAAKFVHQRAINSKLLSQLLSGKLNLYQGNYAVSVMLPAGVDRDAIRAKMLTDLIETSVYYPRPVPHFSYYRNKYGYGRYPVAEDISHHSIALSVGPHLTQDKIIYQAERLLHHVFN